MHRRVSILLLAGALLGTSGCSAQRATVAPAPVTSAAAPTPVPALAPAPAPAPSAPPVAGGNLAAVEPAEIRVVMVDLRLAHALDLCGFPALGTFIRESTQKRIESCPNSTERKAALNSLLASATLRERRLDDEARARGDTPRCYASDKLAAIKETIPIAERLVARAERPLDCGDISSAAR